MEADRIRWNRRFASAPWYLGESPSPSLVQLIDRFDRELPGRKALDIACGEGRNSLFLARRGYRVTAVDISDAGIEKGSRLARRERLPITFLEIDLDLSPLPEGPFDLILTMNYLKRSLIPEKVERLTPGGMLLFDTILLPPEGPGGHDPSFFLLPGEITTLFQGLDGEILMSEESPGDPMPTARLLFRKHPL